MSRRPGAYCICRLPAGDVSGFVGYKNSFGIPLSLTILYVTVASVRRSSRFSLYYNGRTLLRLGKNHTVSPSRSGFFILYTPARWIHLILYVPSRLVSRVAQRQHHLLNLVGTSCCHHTVLRRNDRWSSGADHTLLHVVVSAYCMIRTHTRRLCVLPRPHHTLLVISSTAYCMYRRRCQSNPETQNPQTKGK